MQLQVTASMPAVMPNLLAYIDVGHAVTRLLKLADNKNSYWHMLY